MIERNLFQMRAVVNGSEVIAFYFELFSVREIIIQGPVRRHARKRLKTQVHDKNQLLVNC